ncbi:MAG: hypothetical protein GC159_13055 [Phycisphaera sp.]|nr:hypothetical protein [Phycisphaera sp.]
MRIAGWRYPVVVDLAGMNIPSQARPIRFSHDPSSGVGHTDSIRVESGTLVATGLISRDTPAAREVVVSSKNGFPWQASIGSTVEEFEFVRDNQKVMVNGREYVGPVNVVRKSTLGEISFVDLGADGQTSISVAAAHPSHQEHSVMDDVNSTTHVDTNAATPAPAPAPGIAPGVGTGKPASPQPAPGKEAGAAAGTTSHADAPLLAASAAADDIRAHALAETQRIADVRRVCTAPGSNGQFASIEAQAIREGWDATRTELEVLRASRPKAPMVYIPGAGSDTGGGGGGGVNTAVLEAACVLTAGSSAAEKQFDEQTLDAASKRFRGGIGLQELLLEAAWANGYTGRNFRDSRAVLRHAFNQNVQAGFSTIDIGGILSNVANKFLLEGFFSVERTWRNICSVRNVSDFKTVTSYRLIGKDQYEKVAPGGELKHGTLGEESYSNKADTYGLLLSIDRRDIINDDLGAITTVPRKLGRGSGLKINDVFWATFLDNAAFFTAALKNYLAGADTALSIDGLTKGEVAFMDQVDAEGKPIGIMPAILLAPTALSALGTTLWKSLEIRDTTASTKYPIANPHVGKFRVEVSRYLSNSQYTGNSSKAWYLLADPNDLSVIEVAFLNGQESPTIETAEADFNVLGVQMRGYHDFGVALQEPRGGVKAKGEA